MQQLTVLQPVVDHGGGIMAASSGPREAAGFKENWIRLLRQVRLIFFSFFQ